MSQHPPFEFEAWSQARQQRIEQVLASQLPSASQVPETLHSAMRYAVLGGGKRVRALLCYAGASVAGGSEQQADAAAAAVELIHAFSLVHDDMPCMDDDDLRRGKPSCHKQYDEATALLVGDALQSHAFEVLANANGPWALKQVALLATATGSRGMCGGQSIDLASTGQHMSIAALEQMHQYKTGALIQAAVMLGAYSAPAPTPTLLEDLSSFSRHIGLAFQVVDDILDVTADSVTLGKTAGKDQSQHKSTYVSVLGLEASKTLAERLYQQALAVLDPYQTSAAPLRAIAHFICERPY